MFGLISRIFGSSGGDEVGFGASDLRKVALEAVRFPGDVSLRTPPKEPTNSDTPSVPSPKTGSGQPHENVETQLRRFAESPGSDDDVIDLQLVLQSQVELGPPKPPTTVPFEAPIRSDVRPSISIEALPKQIAETVTRDDQDPLLSLRVALLSLQAPLPPIDKEPATTIEPEEEIGRLREIVGMLAADGVIADKIRKLHPYLPKNKVSAAEIGTEPEQDQIIELVSKIDSVSRHSISEILQECPARFQEHLIELLVVSHWNPPTTIESARDLWLLAAYHQPAETIGALKRILTSDERQPLDAQYVAEYTEAWSLSRGSVRSFETASFNEVLDQLLRGKLTDRGQRRVDLFSEPTNVAAFLRVLSGGNLRAIPVFNVNHSNPISCPEPLAPVHVTVAPIIDAESIMRIKDPDRRARMELQKILSEALLRDIDEPPKNSLGRTLSPSEKHDLYVKSEIAQQLLSVSYDLWVPLDKDGFRPKRIPKYELGALRSMIVEEVEGFLKGIRNQGVMKQHPELRDWLQGFWKECKDRLIPPEKKAESESPPEIDRPALSFWGRVMSVASFLIRGPRR